MTSPSEPADEMVCRECGEWCKIKDIEPSEIERTDGEEPTGICIPCSIFMARGIRL